MFIFASLDAAVHLGKDYLENLHSTKKQAQRTIRQLFDVSQKLNTDHTEKQVVSQIGLVHTLLAKDNFVDRQSSPVIDSRSLSSTIQYCVLAKINPHPESTDAWKKKIECFTGTLNIESWIEPMERQWNSSGKFPRIHNITDPRRDSQHDVRNAS